uniref:Uncharacterized protein n=1 Tax=Arundo donax TaxID=35708 RepID=A0A0A9D6C0_ARUDO
MCKLESKKGFMEQYALQLFSKYNDNINGGAKTCSGSWFK